MDTLLIQIMFFSSEVLCLIDAGAILSMDNSVEKMNDGSIVDYVHSKCPSPNVNFKPSEAALLKSALQNLYTSKSDAYTKGIENNGLIYLIDCLMQLMQEDFFRSLCAKI